MNPQTFELFLGEIYSNFGRNAPAHGTPMWNNLNRRLEAIPDEAAKEIAYAFSEYDTLPMNLGKAILAEFSRWKSNHPEKIRKRDMCPYCNAGTAGWCYAHDANGKNYLLRCTCNTDTDPTAPEAAMATRQYLEQHGLTFGKAINPADPDGTKGTYDFLSPQKRNDLIASFNLGATHKVRREHMQAREDAGVYGFDAF